MLKFYPDRKRPIFSKRVVISAGMPYGSKELHFGHIGGVFVHADAFSRFLKDRIGSENVLFISGTDCYGSPIVEAHRQLTASAKFEGSLEEFVNYNYKSQKNVLKLYNIDLSLFAASSISPYLEIHREIGEFIMKKMYANGHIKKLRTPQFFDTERNTFLNGRQVIGRCPVLGCRSEKAYADECSLGHQYEPKELIAPKSTLTGKSPEMRDVINWYVKLPELRKLLKTWLDSVKQSNDWRPFVVSSILENFEPPIIHITRDQIDALEEMQEPLPEHTKKEGRGKSLQLIFTTLENMEEARKILAKNSIRYRTGKTLVPFRLTGNLQWGLPAPDLEDTKGLTFWVWPESLWAPVAFTAAYLKEHENKAKTWKDWWCSKDSKIYQFIGEDNIFFYSLPQSALFLGVQSQNPIFPPPDGEFQTQHLVSNKHILFLDKKASSSGKVKPPMAKDLLKYYTSDQLRTHFLSLALGTRSVSFRPKPLNPNATEREGDPVLKEGNLLSNAFNRAARSCFYTVQKFFDSVIPYGEVSEDVLQFSEKIILDFEQSMYKHEFHQALITGGVYIRAINQRWSINKAYSDDCDVTLRSKAIIDAFYMLRIASVLMHSIAPEGTEKILEYLKLGTDFWNWDHIFEPLYFFMDSPKTHKLKFLEPRVDFFPKHPSQITTRT